MADIYIGGNKTITITALDSDGVAEDLSSFEGYIVVLYYLQGGTVVQQYSKNVVTGYDNSNIGTGSEASGILSIYVTRTISELGIAGGEVWAQVLVQETDANYGSSQYRDWGSPKYAFTFKTPSVKPTVDVS